MAKVSLRAYNQEIETMIDRGHLDEAIAHCRHILKTFPKHLETYRLLGKAYLEYKRYPEAADIFTRVLVAVPSDFVSNVGMSIIRDEENRLDDAIWHMERAFETQPSNAAIQSEMQRLYGRREGVQPPRIRMTRGALAHMYVQGELYPQAISEIKSVLKEDPGRNDMQALLARAYYRSGLKNDSAEVATAVLRSNPYNLDANRIMVEILGTDHPESVGAYRQRVVELDPYAAQVTGSIFTASEVPDAAVSLEHLDWNGQPVGLQPDWQSRQAISLEGEAPQEEQPDWLKSALGETSAPGGPAAVSPFDAAAPFAGAAEGSDEIPDFLRDAGWGKSTGAFDESQSAFAETEPAGAEAPIERGELPDWVKAMAPQQTPETPAGEEEELPDWINKIGTSALPVPSETAGEPDWMKGLDETPAQPTEGQPDWLKGFAETEQPAMSASSEEPDWLKGFANEPEAAQPETPAGDLDWLTQLSQGEAAQAAPLESAPDELEFISRPSEPFDAAPAVPASEGLDWLDQAETQSETTSVGSSSDDFDFLDPLGSQFDRKQAALPSEDLDFLSELTPEPFSATTPAEASAAGAPGTTEQEQDDAFAWLESLAAKQGATEGLLTRPEERLDEEPDWVRQAKGVDTTAAEPPVETPAVAGPVASIEELGKTEQEQEDSFAWLESLAAKQGATEGLLTEPEERLEEAPEWVQRAATLGEPADEEPELEELPRSEQPSFVEPEPVADLEALGTTEQERDDSFAWLEALAAKQGATEGLLTRPEERPKEEPDWVRQAKDVAEPSAAAPEPRSTPDEVELWLQSLEGETSAATEAQEIREEPVSMMREEEALAGEPSLETPFAEPAAALDDTSAWLRSLEQEETEPRAEEPASASPLAESPVSSGEAEPAPWLQELEAAEDITSKDDTAAWLKSLDQPEKITPEPERAMQSEELPGWIQDIETDRQMDEGVAAEPAAAEEAPPVTEWMAAVEGTPEPVAQETPKVETGGLPSWLRGLEEEEAQTARFGAEADLPAWLRDETGEAVAEPPSIEPTRAADWQPVEMEAVQPAAAEPETPAFEASQPPETVAPELVAPPAPSPEPADVVALIEEKVAAAGREEPAPARPVRPSAPRKSTGMLDPVLAQARSEFSRSNLSGALENYSRLIKKGRMLEDIIYDLREALYRYPVDVDIWQSLGDAYMRSNRLQDALDAYTKAEELIR